MAEQDNVITLKPPDIGRKSVVLGKILTNAQIHVAMDIIRDEEMTGNDRAPERIAHEVILPILHSINKITGQENDPAYLGYAIAFALRPHLIGAESDAFDCGDPSICE
jgi:hypothetical protein